MDLVNADDNPREKLQLAFKNEGIKMLDLPPLEEQSGKLLSLIPFSGSNSFFFQILFSFVFQ